MNLLQRLFGPKKTTISLQETIELDGSVWIHLQKDRYSVKAYSVTHNPKAREDADRDFEQLKHDIENKVVSKKIIRTETF